jgi:hypothetical protein
MNTTLLTSTALTDASRQKAADSTGVDPGPYVYRLHRPTCDRVKPADSPREIDSLERVATYAAQIAVARACTRCTPREFDHLQSQANAALEAQAARAAEAPAPDAPKPGRTRKNGKVGYTVPDGDRMTCTGHLHPEGEDLPVTKFPTVTGHPGARALECRACRNARRDR